MPRSRTAASSIAVAFVLLVAAGCGASDSDHESQPKPAAVTLRFTNPSSADLYVDATFGAPITLLSDNVALDQRNACTPMCSSDCSCYACGAPLPSVRRVPAGGALDVVWEGDHYEYVQNGCAAQCACEKQHFVAFGTYEARLSAGLAVVGGTPSSNDENLLRDAQLDESAPTCSAAGLFQVDDQARTVEISFVCP